MSLVEFDDLTDYNNALSGSLDGAIASYSIGAGSYIDTTTGDQVFSATPSITVNPSYYYILLVSIQTNDFYSGSEIDFTVYGTEAVLLPDACTDNYPIGATHTGCGVLGTLGITLVGIGDVSLPPDDTSTRIDNVDPIDGQEIATSSLPYTFAVDGYINEDDYEEGARIMIKIDRNTDQQAQGALLGWNSAFGNRTYLPLDASGAFDVSTSSDAITANLDFPMDRVGLYRARWEIQVPGFSLFGFALNYSTEQSLNTRFTIGTSTPLDKIQLDQEEYLENIIGSIEGDPLEQCNFNFFDSAFDFRLGSDLLGCIGGMLHWFFVLPPGVLENTVVQLKEGFLTRVPWGYFTRIVTAVQDGAAGTLPTIHADIPIGGGEDISIEFDIDDMVGGAATITDSFVSPDGDTLREIVEPIIQLIVGLLVLMFIWKDIMRSV